MTSPATGEPHAAQPTHAEQPRLRGTAQPTQGRCNARVRNEPGTPARYCPHRPMPNGKCRMHGGATPRGIASANFRHGAYSIAMPSRMRESYEQFVNDPEILSLRREIASHRAVANDLRKRLSDGSAMNAQVAQAALRDAKVAARAGDVGRLGDAMARIERAVQGEAAEDRLRAELRREDELVQKAVERENKRMEMLHQMVSREQALMFMRALSMGVKEAVDGHVVDKDERSAVLRAVSTRFEQLASGRGPADAGPGGRGLPAVGSPSGDGGGA